MPFLNICLCVIVGMFAVIMVVGGFLLLWSWFNKIFYEDYCYWKNHYEYRFEEKEKKLEEEYNKKLQKEIAKVLAEFYEKDERKKEANE